MKRALESGTLESTRHLQHKRQKFHLLTFKYKYWLIMSLRIIISVTWCFKFYSTSWVVILQSTCAIQLISNRCNHSKHNREWTTQIFNRKEWFIGQRCVNLLMISLAFFFFFFLMHWKVPDPYWPMVLNEHVVGQWCGIRLQSDHTTVHY